MTDWESIPLGEFAPFSYGKGLPERHRIPGPFPVVGSGGISGWHREPLVSGPVIVVGRKGTIGSVQRFADGAFPIDTTFWIGESPERDLGFVYYLLQTLNFGSMNSDSAVPGLNRDRAHSVSIRVPPLEEQRRIAGVLGALDDLIDTDRHLLSQLDELGMAAFNSRWRGERAAIGSLGQLTMGQSPPGSTLAEWGEGMPFYQGVRDFGARFPARRVFTTQPTRQAPEGAVLIAVRAPIGDTNVTTEPVAIGRGLAALQPDRPATTLRALRATRATWDAYQGEGTVFASISGADLRSAMVPWVDDLELEGILAVLDEQYKALHDEVGELRRTRDELLPLLMSGRVRVAEAEKIDS